MDEAISFQKKNFPDVCTMSWRVCTLVFKATADSVPRVAGNLAFYICSICLSFLSLFFKKT